jgi:hypothetical protein
MYLACVIDNHSITLITYVNQFTDGIIDWLIDKTRAFDRSIAPRKGKQKMTPPASDRASFVEGLRR